jgi:hypothetical protein
MASRVVIDCDLCDKTGLPEQCRISLVEGWSPDPAGGPSEQDFVAFDICHWCAIKVLRTFSREVEAGGADTRLIGILTELKRGCKRGSR